MIVQWSLQVTLLSSLFCDSHKVWKWYLKQIFHNKKIIINFWILKIKQSPINLVAKDGSFLQF